MTAYLGFFAVVATMVLFVAGLAALVWAFFACLARMERARALRLRERRRARRAKAPAGMWPHVAALDRARRQN